MGQEGLSMRKARDLLRLCLSNGMTGRQAARSVGVSSSTASVYLQRARGAGLEWAAVEAMDDAALERILTPPRTTPPTVGRRPMPDAAYLKRELAKPNVTLALLWTKYKAGNPKGYQYSQFCELARRELGKVDLVLRREHRAGEEMFVDWAGQTVPIVDADTGQTHPASIFIAALGASNYTYFEGWPTSGCRTGSADTCTLTSSSAACRR